MSAPDYAPRLAAAARTFNFTFPGIVDRIIDGDTIVLHIQLMPGLELNNEHIRVQGINAPEMSTTAGVQARDFATTLLKPGDAVTLSSTSKDKYGRVLAKIQMPDGRDFGDEMVNAGHAVPFMVTLGA